MFQLLPFREGFLSSAIIYSNQIFKIPLEFLLERYHCVSTPICFISCIAEFGIDKVYSRYICVWLLRIWYGIIQMCGENINFSVNKHPSLFSSKFQSTILYFLKWVRDRVGVVLRIESSRVRSLVRTSVLKITFL